MFERIDWEAITLGKIRSKMANRNISYSELVANLDLVGIQIGRAHV